MDQKDRQRNWFQRLGIFWKVTVIFTIGYILRWIIEGYPIDVVSVITTLFWATLINVISSIIGKIRENNNDASKDDQELKT